MTRSPLALRLALALVPVPALAGCLEPEPAADYGDPTNLAVATTQGGITAHFLSPGAAEVQDTPIVHVELSAYTDPPVPLSVSITTPEGFAFTAASTGEPGPDQRFAAEVPLLHGHNALLVRIAEVGGKRSRRIELAAFYEGHAPALRYGLYDDRSGEACGTVLEPSITAADAVCVRGRTTVGAAAIASASAGLDGEAAAEAQLDGDGRFEVLLPLAPDATDEVVVTVVDQDGVTNTVRRAIVQDSTPPALGAPLADASPTRTASPTIVLDGTVSDAYGVAELRLENDAGGVVALAPTPSFERTLQLEPGENGFELVAFDVAGNETRLAFAVIRDRLIRLGPPGSAGQALLNLDRDALDELLTDEDQQETDIVQIGLRTAVLSSLYRIRDPEVFGVDTSEWGQAEWNLNDLLNMTPDTANLEGSSLEELITIAPSVSLPSPRLLADLLSLEPTDTFVDLDVAADVVLAQLVGTHPNVDQNGEGEPVLTLTLYDVLNDLAPLAGRFGPVGGHPGFLEGAVTSEVFEPGFLMSIPATSSLAPYEGVDASRGAKDYFFVAPGDDVLVLDFASDDFAVVGLVDEPTVDLRFILGESASVYGVSTSKTASPDAERPGFYRGNGGAFTASPWFMERIVAEIAYLAFHPLFASSGYGRTLRYDAGVIDDAAVIDWDRGWVTIATSGGIGNPPAPTYVWDILTEVAQLRLHEGGVPEGGVNLAFPLEDLPIGLDAEGLVDALRPTLESQAEELASRIVSADGLVASGVDFYFVADDADGPGFLFFRAPGDAAGDYGYVTPGFFEDPELTTKASTSTALPGTSDTTHEKVVPVAGDVFYFADAEGDVFELEIVIVDADGVAVRVAPVMESVP